MQIKHRPQTDTLNVNRNAILIMREGGMLQWDVGNKHFSRESKCYVKVFHIPEDCMQKSETVSNTVTYLMADGSLSAEQW